MRNYGNVENLFLFIAEDFGFNCLWLKKLKRDVKNVLLKKDIFILGDVSWPLFQMGTWDPTGSDGEVSLRDIVNKV